MPTRTALAHVRASASIIRTAFAQLLLSPVANLRGVPTAIVRSRDSASGRNIRNRDGSRGPARLYRSRRDDRQSRLNQKAALPRVCRGFAAARSFANNPRPEIWSCGRAGLYLDDHQTAILANREQVDLVVRRAELIIDRREDEVCRRAVLCCDGGSTPARPPEPIGTIRAGATADRTFDGRQVSAELPESVLCGIVDRPTNFPDTEPCLFPAHHRPYPCKRHA